MAIISAITAQQNNKERCNIFIDGEYKFALSLELVLKNRLKVGLEISEQRIEEMLLESEKSTALSKVAKYVSTALKTKKQIKDYLAKKGYCQQTIYYCIDKLKEYGYINDVNFSLRYIESVYTKQGKRLIESKLMQKGVCKQDIEQAFIQFAEQTKENDNIEDAFSVAKNIAQKYIKNKEITKENIAKTYRYLIGKGFSYEQASVAIEQFKEE